ncbi:MAG TPA: hypothetical protein PK507_04510 [bacterium]|nr:hypothetical protein [bacterium]
MNTFIVNKISGTYSDALEAYGLANLLNKIFDNRDIILEKIIIEDKGLYFQITISPDITSEDIDKLSFFSLFPFIKQNNDIDISIYPDYFDYIKQKELKKEKQELINKIYNEYKDKNEREKKLKEIDNIYQTIKYIDPSLDVFQQFASYNNYITYEKLYLNFYNNKDIFNILIKEILHYYSDDNYTDKTLKEIIKNRDFNIKITAIQLLNPSKGKGIKSAKANNASNTNFNNSNWIEETMKIIGSLSDMVCQLVKVGTNSYDLKVFVPSYKKVSYSFKQKIIPDFKNHLKGNTPIKIDILNILILIKIAIQHLGNSIIKQKVNNIIDGLYSVYQKDLGQGKAVSNISYLQIPNFIYISNKIENDEWVDILDEQINIIGSIDEQGETIQGLMLYRNFISTSSIYDFLNFSYWYATYLSSKLSKNEYAIPFDIETLNKFYKNMETQELNLSEIISNPGFQAIAKAIRNSTVTLQFTPKEERMFDIRYGVAQELKSKSKSKSDLAEFIGEFISFYNAEIARNYEIKGKTYYRSTVKHEELDDFYALLDKYPSRLVGALLASYGFALSKREVKNDENKEENIKNDTENILKSNN